RCDLIEPRSRVPLEQRRVTVQVKRPAGLVVDSVPHGLPAGAVPIEVAVLELDAGALRSFREESHLTSARQIWVALNLPTRADVPAENDPVWRFEHENPCPSAFAT